MKDALVRKNQSSNMKDALRSADRRTLNITAKELNRRLAEMNEFRQENKDLTELILTRREHEIYVKDQEDKHSTKGQGRLTLTVGILGIVAVVLSSGLSALIDHLVGH